jgi:hypothetical protein
MVPTFLFDRTSLGAMTLVDFGPIINRYSLLGSSRMHKLEVEMRAGHVLVGASWANHSTQPFLLLSALCSPCLRHVRA